MGSAQALMKEDVRAYMADFEGHNQDIQEGCGSALSGSPETRESENRAGEDLTGAAFRQQGLGSAMDEGIFNLGEGVNIQGMLVEMMECAFGDIYLDVGESSIEEMLAYAAGK